MGNKSYQAILVNGDQSFEWLTRKSAWNPCSTE